MFCKIKRIKSVFLWLTFWLFVVFMCFSVACLASDVVVCYYVIII